MIEQNNHPMYFSEEQSPIQVPLAEAAWKSMKEKLDANLPVTRWQRFIKIVSHVSPKFSQFLFLKTGLFVGALIGTIGFLLVCWVFMVRSNSAQTSPIIRTNLNKQELPLAGNKIKRKQTETRFAHPSRESSFNTNRPKDQNDSILYEFKKGTAASSTVKVSSTFKSNSGSLSSAAKRSVKHLQETNDYLIEKNSATEMRDHNAKNTHPLMNHRKVVRYSLVNEERIVKNYSFAQGPFSISDSLITNDKKFHSTILGKKEQNKIASQQSSKQTNKSKSGKSGLNPGAYRNMSVGIEISKTFPLGSQETSPYNSNAKQNLLSDYIPAPYFRFYFNRKTYLEAALHVNSPQYVRSSALESHTDSLTIPTGPFTLKTTSVILNKLYYFDIPIVLHYRIFKNLYLGGGFQFSALSGGVGTEETRLIAYNATTPDSVTSSSISLKDNSSAFNQLKKLDLRFLVDANYQWRRLTIGLRYQQGLLSYLKSSQGNSNSSDRNSALGIYLQFDIWRRR